MDKDEKAQRLDRAINTVQQRWGHRALFRGDGRRSTAAPPSLSTGFPRLDDLLGTGGLPLGRITELVGSGTSGHVTLAAHALAQAQRAGRQVVYVDVEHQIDLDLLARCGVSFEALAVLRPLNMPHAVDMTRDLLVEGGAGAIVFDRLFAHELGTQNGGLDLLDRALREWNLLIGRSSCAFLFITEVESLALYPSALPLPYFASLRLGFTWGGWLSGERPARGLSPHRVDGFCSHVTVLKNRLGPAGQSVSIDMHIVER